MLVKILGALDIIAGFLILLGNPIGSYYLLFKGLIFIIISKGTSILSWTDFLLGIMLIFFFSNLLAFIIFIYLLVKSILSFM